MAQYELWSVYCETLGENSLHYDDTTYSNNIGLEGYIVYCIGSFGKQYVYNLIASFVWMVMQVIWQSMIILLIVGSQYTCITSRKPNAVIWYWY